VDIVERYQNEPWDWGHLSCNPNITMDIIERYPNKPWDWFELSRNPNITMDIVERYPNRMLYQVIIQCNKNHII